VEHISLAQFEDYFDEIMARVVDDKIHYTITTDDGLSVVLVPIEAYDVLKETYNYSLLEDQPNDDLSGPYTQEGVS
jgi:prevent-host-death family protein